MKKLPKYIVEKSLRPVGHMRLNGYCVECDLLEDGRIKMNMTKNMKYVPYSTQIVEYEYFQERFRDEDKSDHDLLIDALAFCEPGNKESQYI